MKKVLIAIILLLFTVPVYGVEPDSSKTEPVAKVEISAVPSVEVLPPSILDVMVAINRLATDTDKALKGKLILGNVNGVMLKKEVSDFEMKPKEKRTIVRFRMTQPPASIFSFAMKLVDEQGKEILREPTRRYSVVQTFADGKDGAYPEKYSPVLDGDDKVRAEAQLTYARAPKGGPNEVCIRLDYNFDKGSRVVKLIPTLKLMVFADHPRSAKVWVKGNSSDAVMRLRFTDATGQVFQQDYGKLDFADWQCMEAKLTDDGAEHWDGKNDGKSSYPIAWDTLLLIDPLGQKMKGRVYLGTIMMCYD